MLSLFWASVCRRYWKWNVTLSLFGSAADFLLVLHLSGIGMLAFASLLERKLPAERPVPHLPHDQTWCFFFISKRGNISPFIACDASVFDHFQPCRKSKTKTRQPLTSHPICKKESNTVKDHVNLGMTEFNLLSAATPLWQRKSVTHSLAHHHFPSAAASSEN